MHRIAILLPAVLLTACASLGEPSAPAMAAAQRLPLEVCQLDGIEEPLLCGTYAAPLDYNAPNGATINIKVVVIPALDGNPQNQAWTEHQGGPGREALPVARFFTNTQAGRQFRENRDIVLMDQRGVGESGGLYCEAMIHLPVLAPYYTEEKVRACREEMESQGVDLAGYSTLAAVDDLEAVRQWLGYPQFDVGGWSYGSRFMLTYANRYPDSVRTLMVALPTLFDYRRPLDWARFGEEALNKLFADCAETPRCNLVFPNLRGDYATALARLERKPVTVEFHNPVTGQDEQALVDRNRFIEELQVAMLRVSGSRMIPLAIHEAAKGAMDPFIELAVPARAPRPISEAQYLSIVCPEETAFFGEQEAEKAAQGASFGMYYVDEFKMACAAWGLPPHPGYPLEWTRPQVPALVISGGRDPITPTEYGERIAASLPNALHIDIALMPHDFTGLPGSECLDTILLEFLESGSERNLDTSCLQYIHAPPFTLELAEEEK